MGFASEQTDRRTDICECRVAFATENSKKSDIVTRGIFVLWIWGLMNQFLKDHQLNKAEFGVTDGSISVWISGPQDKNPSIRSGTYLPNLNSDIKISDICSKILYLPTQRK